MAASNRILCLNLGTQTLSLAEFRTGQNGGLVLTNYKTSELLADPSLPESSRLAQAKLALSEMVASMGYRGQKVNFAISSHSIFTRFVKLPSVGEEQVDQIVTFEAQQNVPYPLQEVVWDYQLVDSGEESQVEVAIVAIKSDLLDEINHAVEGSGLHTTVVDVAPMALYNAFRYNYSELEGCSLVIDIGARTTNLIFIEPHKVFSRSILKEGGNIVTQAIGKDFNEGFGEADARKKRDGFVSLGGSYSDPDDPDVARVSKIVRNSMTRLHAEIARSISFYRSQQHGSAPVRIFLCGGTAGFPYMREFFQEKLQLPVEFFNPLRNVAVEGTRLDLDHISHHAHTFGELVGLALRSTSSCPMEFNLSPPSVLQRQRLLEQRPFLVLTALCVLLALGGWLFFFQHAASVTAEAAAKIDLQSAPLRAVEAKFNSARNEIKKQEEAAAPLLQAVHERQYWPTLIGDINSRLPKSFIWITNMSLEEPKADGSTAPAPAPGAKAAPHSGTRLLIQGLYSDNPRGIAVVDEFLANLAESKLYEVKKDELKRTVPDELAWGWEFQFPLVLKDPINLPKSAK